MELEILPLRVAAGIECLVHDDGGSFRAPWPVAGPAHEAVLLALKAISATPLVVHSTSWHQEEGRLVVTYAAPIAVVSSPPRTRFIPVAPGRLARGDALVAPTSVNQDEIVRHAVQHLAWLWITDDAIRWALLDWELHLRPFELAPFLQHQPPSGI